MQTIDLTLPQGAIFSDDGKYRYALWRVWSKIKPMILFIGLNPSKASQIISDPTITRLMSRAYREGFGGIFASNLYAYVSTKPDVLLGDGDFIGQFTDEFLKQMVELSNVQLCGWGSFKPVTKRAPIVLGFLKDPVCLGINSDGQPKHPLYVGYNVPLVKYNALQN